MTSDYPFRPTTTSQLEPGHFWGVPLRYERFGCGLVLQPRATVTQDKRFFVAALLDWVGDAPPTADAIASAEILSVGTAPLELTMYRGGQILGRRALRDDQVARITDAERPAYWSSMYCASVAERRYNLGHIGPTSERRTITSPLTDEMLRPSPFSKGVIQFRDRLSDSEYKQVASWLERHPAFSLRAYASTTLRDLEFLKFFPSLRHLAIDCYYLESLDGLRHLGDRVADLGIGSTRKRMDLKILGRFSNLETLHLERHTRNFDVVSTLLSLKKLSLRSITLAGLEPLIPLDRLTSLEMRLGGTRNLKLLPKLETLRYIEIWRVKGLTDITDIEALSRLEYLFLQTLNGVTALPDLTRATSLRRIHLETMKGIRDLSPLATAPNLEEIILLDMPQLQPADFNPLVGMRKLRAASIGIGSSRKNTDARNTLGVWEVTWPFEYAAS